MGLFAIARVLLCAAVLPWSPALEEDAYPPVFEAGWDDALATAEERNLPLVCILLLDGEEKNERFYDEVLSGPEFTAALTDTLLVVAMDDEHPLREIEVRDADGNATKRQVCSRLGTSSCAVHQGYSRPVFDRYKAGSGDEAVLQTPFLAVLMPDGSTHLRVSEPSDRKKLITALTEAKKKAGTALSAEEHAALRAALRVGEEALSNGRAGEAWRAYASVLAHVERGPLSELARAGTARAEALRGEELAHAHSLLEAGSVADGWDALNAWAGDWQETSFAKAAKAEVEAVRKDKRWREEIRWLEHEREGTALYEEARAFWSQGDERKAVRQGKRLLDKYGDTEAAARLYRELPALVERIKAAG